MEARPARITLAAGIAFLVGPACAVLPYTSNFTVFPNSFLGDVWLLAAIGAIGVGAGAFAFRKGSKIVGTNLPPDQYPRPRLL